MCRRHKSQADASLARHLLKRERTPRSKLLCEPTERRRFADEQERRLKEVDKPYVQRELLCRHGLTGVRCPQVQKHSALGSVD